MLGAVERSSSWELVRAHNKSTESGSAPDTRDQQQSTHGKQPLYCFPSQQSRVAVLLPLPSFVPITPALSRHTTARCVLSSVPQRSPWIHLYKQESLAIRLVVISGTGAARIFEQTPGLPVVAVDSATLHRSRDGLRKGAAKSDSTPIFSLPRSPSKSLLSTNHAHHM
ncbi:unnamed protein product, partial [Ectocarpus sp. 12 AP-2014]